MKAYVYGSQDFSKLVAQIAHDCEIEIAGFIDDFKDDGTSVSYESVRDHLVQNQTPVFLGIGYKNLQKRSEILGKLKSDKVNLPNLIHPASFVHKTATMGVANIFMSGTHIDAFSQIGDANVFWPSTTISHDATIQSGSFFSPASVICGFVKLGNNCFVGANATVVDKVSLPDGTFIKAGSIYKGFPR